MPKELSESDMADYRVTYHLAAVGPNTIRAAYVTTEERLPGMLAFKDHEHQAVALVSREAVLSVERLEPEHVAEKEIAERGFKPTSQVMEGM